ncbi:MAG TPA: ABC transporter permease [Candidatus Saccharimonadaceae bacterium]|jgi:ABC-2 type transport system permease protein|nr:ABC transporter permease [Candidatus Saccharimonadaceae bacterium]
MIGTLLGISRTNLRRDRVALAMVFVLPIMFFSIFAAVFGRPSSGGMSRVRLLVANEDGSDMSRYLIEALKADPGLGVSDSAKAAGVDAHAAPAPLTRERATALVRAGDAPIALVLPKGWGATFPNLTGNGLRAELLADPSDPVARHVVAGLLQRAAATVMRGGPAAGTSTAPSAGAAPSTPSPGAKPGAGAPDLADASVAGDPVPTHVTEVLGRSRRGGQMISFYAAGIAVMFLLFSCAAGGGALLDEQDSGTLERVLNTRVGMNGLLAGKWLHLTFMGVLQITVMFTWGMLAFGLDLTRHLPGFFVMTAATAAAAAGFGLVLATLSRSRQQLMGFANLIILSMSALGGSMFPRFLMSPTLQKIGLITFNAWALDGFVKVFWRDAPIVALAPQVGVLVALTLVFLAVARMLARRWEAA